MKKINLHLLLFLFSIVALSLVGCKATMDTKSNTNTENMENQVIRRTAPYKRPQKKVLYIVSNPATLHGFPVGFFAEELTRPYFEFIQAGYEVDLASPKGGKVEFDGFSDPENMATTYPNDLVTIGFSHHKDFSKLMENTKSIADFKVSDYDAVCVAGGGGPLITFKDDVALHKFIADFYEQGKVVGMLCHGSSLLLWTKLSDGTLLADGKTWTGYCDAEEKIGDDALGFKINPYTIETEAKKNPNTNFEAKAPLVPYAIRDGRLITGQQQHSSALFAELVIEALSETDE
ncbi:MAG: type 1 glutamine amidotransferase domain-containing protein [Bacteroidota bacterium]